LTECENRKCIQFDFQEQELGGDRIKAKNAIWEKWEGMVEPPFGSSKVIIQRISQADLKTYLVGFDIDDLNQRYYRLENLVELLQKVIPEFAFGHHEGTVIDITKITDVLREAANAIYKIEEFEGARKIYESGGSISDDDAEKRYLKRGEFGELLLHLLLRDFHSTVPLLSKIYFKDSYSSTVHGFDAVHIQPETKTLWLGEAKLYVDPKKGIADLIHDIKAHFKRNYLHDEFAIISKKLKTFKDVPEKEHWLDILSRQARLSDILASVTIPLLCTYSSDNFSKYDDENLESFVVDYKNEVLGLKRYFDESNDHPLKTNLNIILLLFPVRSKNELVKRMHEKLHQLQRI
jgi:hypothetical protein